MKIEHLESATRLKQRLLHRSTLLKRVQQHRHPLEVIEITVEGHELASDRSFLIPLASLVRLLRDDIDETAHELRGLGVLGTFEFLRTIEGPEEHPEPGTPSDDPPPTLESPDDQFDRLKDEWDERRLDEARNDEGDPF